MKAGLSDFLRFVSLELKGFDSSSIHGTEQNQRQPPGRFQSLKESSDTESSASAVSVASEVETLANDLKPELHLPNIPRLSIDSTDTDKEPTYTDVSDAIPRVFGHLLSEHARTHGKAAVLFRAPHLPLRRDMPGYAAVRAHLHADTGNGASTSQAVSTVSHMANRFVTYIARELKYLVRNDIAKPASGDTSHRHAPNKYSVTLTEICGCVRFLVLLATIWLFSFIDTSKVYHNIKAQPVMKLYVIFNMLEIFERLCRSFTRDMMESLIRTTIRIFLIHFDENEPAPMPEPPPVEKKPTPKKKNKGPKKKQETQMEAKTPSYAPMDSIPVTPNLSVLNSSRKYSESYNIYYKFALLYVSVVLTLAFHSFLHLVRVLSLNIAINSPESTMFLLLITNNFAEIKSTVFKKYDSVSLFVIFASDAVERCYLVFDAVLVILKMSTSRRWAQAHAQAPAVVRHGLHVAARGIRVRDPRRPRQARVPHQVQQDPVSNVRKIQLDSCDGLPCCSCSVQPRPPDSRQMRRALRGVLLVLPCVFEVGSQLSLLRRLGFMASPIVTLIVCSLPKLCGCLSGQTFAFALLTWLSLLLLKVSTSILLIAYSVKNRDFIYTLDPSFYKIGSL